MTVKSKRYGGGKAPAATGNPFGQQGKALRAGKSNPATKKSKRGSKKR